MPVTVSTDPDLPLDALGTVVAQQEELLGPLVTLGNNGRTTVLTFDMDRAPPEKTAVIGVGDPPPRTAVFATGKVFVSGQIKDVFALRPAV